VARLLLDREAGAQRPRGAGPKLREALLAWRLEGGLSKDEILSLYLTLAPYGNQIAGIRRASLAYFGVEPAHLTPAQAAYLAALPQQPSRFNPRAGADRATSRAQWILRRMARHGVIDAQGLDAALAERMSLAPSRAPFLAPHFVQMVLAGRRGPAARIVTTIDAGLQRDVEGIIAAHRPQLEQIGARHAAVTVLDNRTGQWLAWEGSGDYASPDGGAINGPAAPRQPGSALKPFTYALAFDAGYDPGTILPDVPTAFATAEEGVTYRPENYDGRYRGPMRARAALAGSENVPAVALASDLGVPRLQRLLRLAGFTSFDRAASHYGVGLTLGNAEVRLDELVAAYAGLARGGLRRPTSHVIEIDGREPERDRAEPRFVSYRAAWWTTDILSDADARAFIFGRGGALEFPFPVAVKTGTSQAFRDNWVVGYTRDLTVGVWVGNFDRVPLVGSSGVAGAGPIFHAVMQAAVERAGRDVHDAADILPRPDEVERREICLVSGMAAGAACLRRGQEWTAPGRRDQCTWHTQQGTGTLTRWPDEYRRWAAWEGLPMAPAAPREPPASTSRATGLRIMTPQPDAVYLIDPTLRPDFQTLPLAADGASGTVRWTVDGRDAGVSAGAATVDWRLVPGRHIVIATDQSGRVARAAFLVK
ncbi:MAG: transglycosylase domain-containing protein, partial [Acidobacteriota bacterium]|nr:transglycosylase domain-containing protein [Acidobacteriota bacterium]